SLAAALDDNRGGAEADFVDRAFDNVTAHSGEIGIARRLCFQSRANTQAFEQAFEINPGRGLVVHDRLGAEQRLFELVDRGKLRYRRGVANGDADSDTAHDVARGFT